MSAPTIETCAMAYYPPRPHKHTKEVGGTICLLTGCCLACVGETAGMGLQHQHGVSPLVTG